MPNTLPPGIVAGFIAQYDATAKDVLWQKQSGVFRIFGHSA